MTNLLVAGQLPRWRNPPTTVVHAADAGLRRLHNACMKRMAPMIPPSRPGADAHGRRRQLLHAGPEPDHEKPARVGARALGSWQTTALLCCWRCCHGRAKPWQRARMHAASNTT